MTRQKWQYKILKTVFTNRAQLEVYLNQCGAEGWEVIGFEWRPDTTPIVYMKRLVVGLRLVKTPGLPKMRER